MSRFHHIVLCAVIVLTGCDTGNDTPNPEDIATDGPPVSQDAATDGLPVSQDTFDQSAPDAGPDKEPPTWTDYAYLSTSNLGAYSVNLFWDHEGAPSTIDNVGVTAFSVYQDDIFVGEVQEREGSSFYAKDLQPDTTYVFQVQAGDAAGNWTTDGPSKEVKTQCPTFADDKCPVSWPPDAVLTPVPTSDTSVLLTWTPAYDNMKVRSYRVLQDGECLCVDTGVPQSNNTVEGDVTEYEVTGLQAGETYHFQVSARDDVGIEHGGAWVLGPEVEVTM